MEYLGKIFIIFGVILIGAGLLLTFFHKVPFIRLRAENHGRKPVDECGNSALRRDVAKSSEGGGTTVVKPWGSIGKLPGDIYIQKKNFTFYFPLATSILASILLSIIFWIWPRR